MKRTGKIWPQDNLVAVRIENGDFNLIGVRRDRKDYISNEPVSLERDDLMMYPEEGYTKVFLELFDTLNNNISDASEDKLLDSVKDYERNGKSDTDDKDIFEVEQFELADIIDALRDGDYIFVID